MYDRPAGRAAKPAGNRPKIALITGGASGIGKATARRFAADGYAIAVLDLDGNAVAATVEELRAGGGAATGAVASVTDEAAVEAAVAEVLATLGGIGVLVNNAGVSCNRPALELSLAEWQRSVDVNLTGVFLCSRAVGRWMVANGGGVIISISSMYGTAAAPDRAGYCAPKSAVDMLTRVLAIEWASKGVRVNAIAPGYIHTSLVGTLVDQGRLDVDALTRRTPLGRLGRPEEVAELAVFLASDSTAFMTGQVLGLDGGWTAYGYI